MESSSYLLSLITEVPQKMKYLMLYDTNTPKANREAKPPPSQAFFLMLSSY